MTTPTPAEPARRPYRRPRRAERDPLRDAAVRCAHAVNDLLHILGRTTSPRRGAPTTVTDALAGIRAQLDRLDRLTAHTTADPAKSQP